MADLILLPTLERLHPHDVTKPTKQSAFGLTLSVALGKDRLSDLGKAEALGTSLLQPWTWKPDKDVEGKEGDFAMEIAGVMFFATDLAKGAAPVPVTHEAPIPALASLLVNRFQAFKKQEERGVKPWSWNEQRMTVSRASRPWPGFVGQLTQYPYPLPQALRLSFFLKLDQAIDLGLSVVAAPVLRFQQNKKVFEVMPQPPVSFEERFRLDYLWPTPEPVQPPPADPAVDSGGAPVAPPSLPPEPVRLSIEAQTVACAISREEAPSSTFFDFGSLWVDPEPVRAHGADWRAGLELRIAEQLHLPRIIVKWMRENRESDILPSKYPDVVWSALQKLREVLGPGLQRKAPDGTFLKRANFFLGRIASDEEIEALRAKADAFFFPTDDDPQKALKKEEARKRWFGWLREAVSGLKESENASSALLDATLKTDPVDEVRRVLALDQAIAALDQLLASVSEPTTLRALFKLQWAALAETYARSESGEAKLARALAGSLPDEVDLERLLLLDHLGRHWEALKKEAFKESPGISAIRDGLKAGYLRILKEAAVPLMSEADLEEFGKRFLSQVLPMELDNVEPRGTRGLTFQLDTLGQDDRGAEDRLRNMQGVALLMRRKSETGKSETSYHCLNLAAIRFEDGTEIDPVLIPSRLAYVNDLRSPTVTYDNGPLTAAGPLSADVVSGAELADDEKGPVDLLDRPLFEIKHSKAQMPGLIFGKQYEVLPFLVTNSGAIPGELAKKGSPWTIKADLSALNRKGVSKPYLREAHIGALRFLSNGAAGLPPIPERVAPQIRELPASSVLPAGDPLLKKKGDPKEKDKDLVRMQGEQQLDSVLAGTPLLLLTPDAFPRRSGIGLANELEFQIAPPTVDLQTWDRWVAGDPAFIDNKEKERRKFIWRSFYQLTDEKGRSTAKLQDAGVYLDDPAVAGIWAELVRIDEETQTRTVLQRTSRLPFQPKAKRTDFSQWKTDACTLVTEQRVPFSVTCRLESEALAVTVKDGTTAERLSGKGRLFCLSFYAYMKDGDETRFSDKGGEEEKEYVRTEGLKGTSPWHLLIEIPQELPKDREAIEKALLSALTPDAAKAKQGKLSVGLNLNKPELAALKGLLYRAEVWHQAWHWRGRPPAEGYEDFTTGDPGGVFEMSEFGPRGDDEHRRLPMPRLAPKNDEERKKKPEPNFLHEEDLDRQGPLGDRRAMAHRFSARVFSRWEGILPEDKSYLETIDSSNGVRWNRHFVPCRYRGDVPAPKIKMVLPMTAGVSENVEDGPGLMVVVDGRWYEVGGLGERLGIEVMTVSDPKVETGAQANPDQRYYQIGTDPIVTSKSAGEAFSADPSLKALRLDKFKVEFTDAVGAIGHHRDHSQTDPRFLASSFLLSRPAICLEQKPKPVDLSWWFLKLRFRRELIVEGQTEPLTSEWSAPFWVQLLPGVERVEEDWLGEGTPLVKLVSGKLVVTGLQKPNPNRDPRHGIHLFAVMTRKVIDFAGRPDQEAYLGVWAWNPQTRKWTKDFDPGTEKDLYVRFIEVQSKKAPSPGALWDSIFKADQKDIDRARIVRISNRHAVNGEKP